MKKRTMRKAIALMLTVVMCLSMQVVPAFAEEDESVVAPCNIAITKILGEFDINWLGKATCYGKVVVLEGYTVEMIMSLQQNVGIWTSLKVWSDEDTDFVMLDESYYVASGYTYRLKLICRAFDSAGNLVETIVETSSEIEY